MNSGKNLLVLFKAGLLNEKAIQHEMDCLNEILSFIDTKEQFCIAFELLDRNRIHSNKEKILKESRPLRLRAFRFLINKN